MAALPFVLGGLAAFGGLSGGTKLLWDNYLKTATNTPYDVVIRINSLVGLGTSGWEIALGESTKNVVPEIPTSSTKRGVVVAVLGSYNRGKSFLLNQLCDIMLPSGNLIHTEGISISTPKKNAEDIIFIDTAGTDVAIPKDKLDDKKATEALLREIALHLCSFIIIVVNRLRATDQTYIQQVLSHTKNSNRNKNIIIVHNLMDVETIEDVNQIIETEVKTLFDAKQDTMKLQMNKQFVPVKFFSSEHNSIKLRHFILTRNDSNAAKIWNRQTIDGIMNILQTATDFRIDLNIIDEMIKFVNTKLTQLFVNNDQNGNTSHDGNQQKIQVQRHARKPNIVLSERKEMSDLEEDPRLLILSPKLVYDDAGYFIGINSMDHGQWQPLYSLYETDDDIYAIVELAGLKKEHVKVKVVEEAIIIEGCRDDLKKSFQQPVIHQEKIPIGQFKLNIPLNCQVEHRDAKLERDDGLYKIKCPKKKVTASYLE